MSQTPLPPDGRTTGRHEPLVSIGLPVFNGANYLGDAVSSILSQSYGNIELIISDNASADETLAICQDFVRQDPRVKYYRNTKNLGASKNYTLVFERASGPYFKWAAHDDVLAVDFIQRCVDVLEADSDCVLCYAASATIDAVGRRVGFQRAYPGLDAIEPSERFQATFHIGEPIPVWGVVRAEVLRRTGLLGPFLCHDRTLLAELALHGRLHGLDEVLFFHREHPERSVRVYDYGRPDLVIGWYAPDRKGGLVLAEWRLLAEYLAALSRAPGTPAQKTRCLAYLLARAITHPRRFGRDLLLAVAQIKILRDHVLRLYARAQAGFRPRRPDS